MTHATGPDLNPVLLRFVTRLRAAGVDASPDRVQAFVAALEVLGAGDPFDVVWAGRLTLCADPLDIARYDRVAAEVFAGRPPSTVQRMRLDVRRVLAGDTAPAGEQDVPDAGERELVTANVSATERLRHRDIALLTDEERAELRRLLAASALVGDLRRSRRHRPAHRGAVDRRRTVRRMLEAGGEPASIARRRPVLRQRDVVLLVDVSGSMAAHADALLRFAHATVRARTSSRTEVFTLGTRLTRVTRELSVRDPDLAMRAVARTATDAGGGTRLGETMRRFTDDWGQRGTARGAVVVVLSDGWELGDATLLGEQTARLSRLAHRLLWANPRAGRAGFTPTAAGMAAALPWVDELVAVTSLAGLEALARAVAGTTTVADVHDGHVATRRSAPESARPTEGATHA